MNLALASDNLTRRVDEQSFEWVWDSDFVSWLRSPEKLFWIVGHPAVTHFPRATVPLIC